MSGRHEPCGANEIWVGNTDKGEARISLLRDQGLRTIRLGSLAYDIDDKPLPPLYKPVFVARAEIEAYDRVMMQATFGPNWRRV